MSLFDFFKKTFVVEEEEPEVQIDEMAQQIRKEKFSTPLIYNEEVEVKEEPVKKEVKPVTKPTTKAKPVDTYIMSEVISPISGRANKPKTQVEAVPVAPKKKVKRVKEDDVVSVISPFYGAQRKQELAKKEEPVKKEVTVKKEEPIAPKKVTKKVVVEEKKDPAGSVTENLRNLASIMKEEGDKLNIIEQRTGEFTLDLKASKEDKPSLIDEIDDSMTLDELMNLYEKKFKD